MLNLSFTLASDAPWESAGHEVAWAQFPLDVPAAAPIIKTVSMPPLRVRESDSLLEVRGANFDFAFDKVYAAVCAWRHEGMSLLNTGPKLSFWRATTDNDRGGWSGSAAASWRSDSLHMLQHRIDGVEVRQLGDKAVRIIALVRIAPPVTDKAFVVDYTYTLYGSGDLKIAVHGLPQGEWCPTLPRIGLTMTLPKCLDKVCWYGRGKGESYVDSKQAQRFGRWRAGVDDLYTPYVFPQECGNRTDVKWVSLTNLRGAGLLAVGEPSINFSALRYSAMDLENARHTIDLVPRDEIFLNLDYRHHGLGSESCGPAPLPKYVLKPEEFRFSLRLKGFSIDGANPARLATEELEEL